MSTLTALSRRCVAATETILDHATDVTAIVTLGYVALHVDPSGSLVAAITTIALGKRGAQAYERTKQARHD